MKSGSRLPLVTLILIVANIAAAFALLFDPDMATQFGFRADHPQITTALSSIFLHENVFHLLGNMLFLAAVGAAVELATGSLRFAIVYFVSGLAGVGVHYLMTHQAGQPAPLIGASGAIAGCAAYYTIRYTSLRVPIAPRLAAPVLAITGTWLALQIVGAFVRIGDPAGVSYWSHLGGFAAGLLLSFAFRAPDLGHRQLGHEVLDRMNDRGPAALEAAAREHLKQHPNDLKALRNLAEAHGLQQESKKEAGVLLQLLQVAPSAEHPDLILRLCQIGQISQLPLLKRLQIADLYKNTHAILSRALLLSVIEGPDDVQKPEAMLSLATLEMAENPEEAANILKKLEAEHPMHPTVEMARKRGWLP